MPDCFSVDIYTSHRTSMECGSFVCLVYMKLLHHGVGFVILHSDVF